MQFNASISVATKAANNRIEIKGQASWFKELSIIRGPIKKCLEFQYQLFFELQNFLFLFL